MPRGINAGNNNRAPMAELRSALTDAGFEAVVTIGQSGNIIATRSGSENQVITEVEAVMLMPLELRSSWLYGKPTKYARS